MTSSLEPELPFFVPAELDAFDREVPFIACRCGKRSDTKHPQAHLPDDDAAKPPQFQETR